MILWRLLMALRAAWRLSQGRCPACASAPLWRETCRVCYGQTDPGLRGNWKRRYDALQ